MTDLHHLAKRLDGAQQSGEATAMLSLDNPGLSVAESYRVQNALIGLREARGETICGVKMGLTSRAKMRQVGVDTVIWGRLTDAMQVADGADWPIRGSVHPRAEPEIAVLLSRPVRPGMSMAEAQGSIAAIAPAIEIIDSRYKDFKFSLPDVVADNASSSAFVIGPASPASIDIGNLGLVMSIDGRPVQVGSSAAILGHPLRSLLQAAELCAAGGVELPAGAIVLLGSATEAAPLRAGQHVRAEIQFLGAVSFHVTGDQG